jgi:hypothetical protein
MTFRYVQAICGSALIAMALCIGATAPGAAQSRSAPGLTDISAQKQQKQQQQPKVQVQRPPSTPKVQIQHQPKVQGVQKQRTTTTVTRAPKGKVGPTGPTGPSGAGPKTITTTKPTVTVAGGKGFRAIGTTGVTRATIRGRNYSVWRHGRRVRYGAGWYTLAALGAITAIAIGTSYYYPWAYLDAPAPYCVGITPDGCELRWMEVPTLDGPPIFQCVAFCPWQ